VLAQSFRAADSTTSAFLSALDLAATHKLQFWDALILNAAAEAGCALLLSEDMASGFVWRGTVVIDPFVSSLDERLTRFLA
jgi:predicted nucleic acid-binding protein